MKQLSEQIFQPEPVILINQKEVKKSINYLGSLKPHKGQKLFELNIETSEVKPVEYKETEVLISGDVRKKYVIKPNHWYAVALNKVNAERKFLNRLKNITVEHK